MFSYLVNTMGREGEQAVRLCDRQQAIRYIKRGGAIYQVLPRYAFQRATAKFRIWEKRLVRRGLLQHSVNN